MPSPAAITFGRTRPSAVGPRELKTAVCVCVVGRSRDPHGLAQPLIEGFTSFCSRSLADGLVAPTDRALNDVAGLEMVREDAPPSPAATTGKMSLAIMTSSSCSSSVWPAFVVDVPKLR